MRIPSYHHENDSRENASMTPMIDIVFLLLIFFVCASIGQVREELLPTELAAGALEASEPREVERPLGEVWLRLERTADDETVVHVNERAYRDHDKLRDTLQALAEAAAEIPVILDIGPEVPVGDMIRVYDTCRAANFDSIHFATDPSETGIGGAKSGSAGPGSG